MSELSSPESLSPNRLNQALISETLSEFPHFEFVSTNTSEQPVVGTIDNAHKPDDVIDVYEANKRGIVEIHCANKKIVLVTRISFKIYMVTDSRWLNSNINVFLFDYFYFNDSFIIYIACTQMNW